LHRYFSIEVSTKELLWGLRKAYSTRTPPRAHKNAARVLLTIELRALSQELKENKWLQPIATSFDD
jgi:hypothetical protein